MASFFSWLAGLFGGRSASPSTAGKAATPAPAQRKIAMASSVKPRMVSLENTEPIVVDPTAVRYALIAKLERVRDVATVENDRLLSELMLKAVHDDSLDLPRFPAVAEELLTLDADSNLDGKTIADLIARDPDLAARIVQIASSPAFGGVRQTSLQQAVTRLGFAQVRYVAIGTAVGDVVYRVPGYDKEVTALRDAGFAAGVFASKLARATGKGTDSGVAFLAGLFHDIGQALVLRNLSNLRTLTKGGMPSQLLVKNLMEEAHLPLGTLYAVRRTLPTPVITAVAAHHEPNRSGEEHMWLSFLVWAADQVQEHATHFSDREKVAKLKESWPENAPPFDKVLEAFKENAERKR